MASPSDITSGQMWFRSDSGVFLDTGLVSGCTDGTLVAAWKNQTGILVNAIETGTGFQPTFYSGGLYKHPRISFSGNKALSLSCNLTDPLTFFLVGNLLSTTSIGHATNAMWFEGGNSDFHQFYHPSSSLTPGFYNGGSTYNLLPVQVPSLKMFTIVSSGASSLARVNQVPVTTTFTPPSVSLSGFAIMNGGAPAFHTFFLNGDVYEIIVYNKALTTGEIATVETYLTGKYPIMPSGANPSFPPSGTAIPLMPSGANPPFSPSGTVQPSLIRCISLGGPTSFNTDNTYGGHLRSNISENFTDGNAGAPCLSVGDGRVPTFAPFRWVIETAGSNNLSISVKQASNVSPRPSVVVRKNVSMGVSSNIISGAPSGTGWTSIGPIIVNATNPGVLIVELWNNTSLNKTNGPALFDDILIT